ncbi:Hsp70 family protein [Rhodococcoides corynebacterioides]|uniref:Hsp70 family protein n=1 Tax=Rhodococcoides corynebacterioides TaxID=53972 RepID=A0ABS7NYC6_9NOCA|nr:Hsp70 family protein [Rhodococcus corynebacterioides]MBY6365130.1 Hsp70 family protein [Rhodococcus corynebacterioides]MBY6406542.1 Hsp70 family protein [Rhodococcus corynebacterioides]
MASGLGTKVGTATAIAVSATSADLHDARVVARPTALEIAPSGDTRFADAAARSGSVVRGFAGRVGDPVDLVTDDGRTFSGDELVARTLACLVEEAGTHAHVVVAHPTEWSSYTVERLRAAAAERGIDAEFAPEALCTVAWLQQTPDAVSDGVVAVVDQGQTGTTASVVRTGDEPALIGRSVRSDETGGAWIDGALLGHVLAQVDTDGLDPADPATVTALAELRDHCAAAKEALSADTDTVVPVRLPGVSADVRVVRSELEELLRESVDDVVRVVDDALRSAGVEPAAVARVVLAGGGGAIPLLTETLSARLRVPLTLSSDPAATSAWGAALTATRLAAAVPAATAGAATDDAETDLIAPVERRPERALPPVPVTPHSHAKPATGRRRAGVVVGVAAAVAVLAAGGLSVGVATGVVDNPISDSPTTSAVVEPASATDPAGAGTTSGGGSATTGSTAGAIDPSTGARIPGSTAAGAPTTGTAPGTTGTAPTGAAEIPGVPAPNLQVPSVNAPTVPAYTPPPAPTFQSPSLPQFTPPNVVGGVANGVGGVAEGVGGVVGGVGDTAGSVVGGVGQGVGGLLGGLTGR